VAAPAAFGGEQELACTLVLQEPPPAAATTTTTTTALLYARTHAALHAARCTTLHVLAVATASLEASVPCAYTCSFDLLLHETTSNKQVLN
jgi:hypothetical protein